MLYGENSCNTNTIIAKCGCYFTKTCDCESVKKFVFGAGDNIYQGQYMFGCATFHWPYTCTSPLHSTAPTKTKGSEWRSRAQQTMPKKTIVIYVEGGSVAKPGVGITIIRLLQGAPFLKFVAIHASSSYNVMIC